MVMKLLSRAEEIILVTIIKLGDQAYGVKIRNQIHKDTGDLWSFATIYRPLDKMARNQLVEKIKGEPTAERGGKSKFYYTVSPAGKEALLALQMAHSRIWDGLTNAALK
ncbi:PadR family transcriptional regulator [bacterium]|nr:PadR family transcriptional regulator [bacterium]